MKAQLTLAFRRALANILLLGAGVDLVWMGYDLSSDGSRLARMCAACATTRSCCSWVRESVPPSSSFIATGIAIALVCLGFAVVMYRTRRPSVYA
jgi:hypothetical protein